MMDANDELNAPATIEPDGAAPPSDGALPTENYRLRFQRVLDYQGQALANVSPLESNLGSINCGLLRMALRLEETIEATMVRTPVSAERMERVYKAIDTHLRVARQIDRFAQVELRAADRSKAGLKKKTGVDAIVGDSSEPPPAMPSEDLKS